MPDRDKFAQKFSFSRTVREDKDFLMEMISEPIKALKSRNIEVDDKTLSILDGMAADVRKRASELFVQAGLADDTQHCQCCGIAAGPRGGGPIR